MTSLAAMALAGSGCLAILGDFEEPASTEAASSQAASTGASAGGGSASSSNSGVGGAVMGNGGASSSDASSSSAGGAGGAGGASGAGGAGDTVVVSCNNAPCEPGMVCCHEIAKNDPSSDYCAEPDNCAQGFSEFSCDGASDCDGNDACCGTYEGTQALGSECKSACDFGSGEFIICDDDPQCPMNTTCHFSGVLGSGYGYCAP